MLSTGRSAPGAYRSLTEGFRKIVREEGTKGLFRGMVPALFGVTHGAFQFMFYEELKVWRQRERQQWRILEQLEEDRCQLAQGVEPDSAALEAVPTAALPSEELTNLDFISLSALSKIFAGTVTYPYQVLRARLQTYDADRLYTSTRDVLQKVWRTEGLQGFYKGYVCLFYDKNSLFCYIIFSFFPGIPTHGKRKPKNGWHSKQSKRHETKGKQAL